MVVDRSPRGLRRARRPRAVARINAYRARSHEPPAGIPAPTRHCRPLLLSTATSTFALDNTATIVCRRCPRLPEYRVVGICWLYCTPFGCSVRTSVKVRHYVPDGGVELLNTGEKPVAGSQGDEHAPT